MRKLYLSVAICSALVLTGCATSPIPIGLPCTVGPVILDKGASTRLTRDEQVQIVTLNNTGEQLCRWKAPS
jgi:hypothetical protein